MSHQVPLKTALSRSLHLGHALRLAWDSAPYWTIINIILLIVQGLLPLLTLYIIREIVNAVEIAATTVSSAAPMVAGPGVLNIKIASKFQPVIYWLTLAVFVALLSALFRSLSEYTSQAQSMLITDHVSDILHSQSILVDLEYYENPTYYDTMHRAQAEAPYRPTSIVNNLTQLGQNGVRLAGLVGLFLSLSPLLGLVILFTAIPGAIVRVVFSRKRYRFEEEQVANERRAWYYHWILTDTTHAKELRLFDFGTTFKERFRDLRSALRNGRLALTRSRATIDFLLQVLASIAIFATLGYAAYRAILGDITIGDLMAIYLGFQMGLSSVQAILGSLAGLYEDNLFLTHFYEFLSLRPTIRAPLVPHPIPIPIQHSLTFEGVSFQYPHHDPLVLDHIDLSLEPGQIIALVGANGSGKTTLIKLLCQLYHPTSGVISVDGIDLRQMDPIEWRRQISVIFQDFIHYFLTAKENIWLGDIHRNLDLEPVIAAAQRSGAHEFICRLPASYDTHLGTWFSDGKELSGGEWQKVALARAFFRKAQLIILDEPTNSLDPLAEAELFRQFRELIHGKSAILISHRFTTVQMADTIYVIDQGRIIERGSHAQLIADNGLYARFYNAQSASYKRPPTGQVA